MYGIINWTICVFAIFCILINIVYTIVYSFKSNNDETDCFIPLIFTNIVGTFGCIMNSIYFEHIDILKLFLIILGDTVFCIILFYASYDSVYKDYMRQVKQDNMNKTIKF